MRIHLILHFQAAEHNVHTQNTIWRHANNFLYSRYNQGWNWKLEGWQLFPFRDRVCFERFDISVSFSTVEHDDDGSDKINNIGVEAEARRVPQSFPLPV